jgi:isopentenyl diphosphate isomerase/L-lactate dehydrogenase-like FMN-dependent dehydrogenase
MHPADAELALDVGVDGVIVSNHGGPQLDSVLPSLPVVPMVAVQVNGRVPVLFDGDIRSGMDLAKARYLSASACLIGRPYLYGLAFAGPGVEAVLRILADQLDNTCAARLR